SDDPTGQPELVAGAGTRPPARRPDRCEGVRHARTHAAAAPIRIVQRVQLGAIQQPEHHRHVADLRPDYERGVDENGTDRTATDLLIKTCVSPIAGWRASARESKSLAARPVAAAIADVVVHRPRRADRAEIAGAPAAHARDDADKADDDGDADDLQR